MQGLNLWIAFYILGKKEIKLILPCEIADDKNIINNINETKHRISGYGFNVNRKILKKFHIQLCKFRDWHINYAAVKV